MKDTLRLTIQSAVAQALAASDEVRISQAQIELADAQVTAARAAGIPQARLTSTYSHAYENARAQAVGSVFNQPNTYNTSLNLSQALFQGGRIIAGRRAAENTREAVRFDQRETRARVSVDAQRAYLQALYTQQVTALQDTNLALAQARLTQVEQLERAGRAARYDVLRARVARSNIEPLVIQSRNDRDIAFLELKRQLNIPVEQPVVLTTGIDAASLRAMIAALVDTLAVPDRPALRSAEATLRAREAAVRVARADYLPTLSLSLQTGYQAFPPLGMGFPSRLGESSPAFCANPGGTQSCQNGGWFSDRSLVASASWPLFDGFRTRSNVAVARAQANIAGLQLSQQRELVGLDVARARSELRRAMAIFEARQQTVAEATEAFQLASLRFSTGLSTQLEVSDAQLSMLNAQSGAVRSIYDLYLAAADLARALGQPVPVPPLLPAGSQ
ncbi:MAG TPA: TolC family protein [Gemmatimonadaceae bacterium]|nr:TolC family protein [Gemmatimonadaceae bacterium]